MSIADEVRAALNTAKVAMSIQDLLDECPTAQTTTQVASAVHYLHRQLQIDRFGTSGKYLYAAKGCALAAPPPKSVVAATWPPGAVTKRGPKPGSRRKPKAQPAAANPAAKRAYKRRQVRSDPGAHLDIAALRTEAPPLPSTAVFAITHDGRFGIDAGEQKISLAPDDFAAMRQFIERVEPVWNA